YRRRGRSEDPAMCRYCNGPLQLSCVAEVHRHVCSEFSVTKARLRRPDVRVESFADMPGPLRAVRFTLENGHRRDEGNHAIRPSDNVQPLFDHYKPGSHHPALPQGEQVHRQPRTDAEACSRTSRHPGSASLATPAVAPTPSLH